MLLPNKCKTKNKLLHAVVYLIAGINASAQYRDLGIGDQCPDICLKHVINYSQTNIHLADFKDKLVILEFWGTWCGRCVNLFPKIDSLQKMYNRQVQILPVTTEDAFIIAQLLNDIEKTRGIKIPSVVNDTLLYRLFYHKYVPHCIWIEDGIVKAVTGSEDINETNIRSFISHNNVLLPVKKDTLPEFDFRKPLFASNQLKSENVLYKSTCGLPYHSIVTGYTQEAPPGSRRRKYFIDCSNHVIKQLYQIAFGSFALELMNDNRIVLENFANAEDSMVVGFIAPEQKTRWEGFAKQYSYCYEQVLMDTTMNPQDKFKFMQDDLNNFFTRIDIKGKLDKRRTKVLALERTSEIDKLKTKGGAPKESYFNCFLDINNKPINYFIVQLQSVFAKPGGLPVLDKTGYKGFIDIAINADISKIPSVNKELRKYDLRLVEEEVALDMIVLTKTSGNNIRALTNK